MTKKKNNKRTNNDLQSIAQKTKARTARTPLKPVDELGCSGEVVPDPHMAPIVLLLLQTGDKSCSIQGVTQVATFNYNYKVFSLF
jgi:hypothetical protein